MHMNVQLCITKHIKKPLMMISDGLQKKRELYTDKRWEQILIIILLVMQFTVLFAASGFYRQSVVNIVEEFQDYLS